MKQYRITTKNLNQSSHDDCFIDPSDPINELKIINYLGGLGSDARLHEYRAQQSIISNAARIEKGKQ